MSGRRTEAIFYLCLILLSYLMIARKTLKFKYFVPGVMIFAVFMYIISQVRGEWGIDSNTAIESLKENTTTISPITQELAFNCSSLQIVMTDIPDKIPYLYGLTWIGSFVSAIPAGPSLIGGFISIPIMYQKSDNLVTILALGEYTWGLGTSILADIYVNFGLLGIIIFMFMFGYVIRLLEEGSFSEGTNPYFIGLSLVVYSSLIYIVRGSIWFSIGPIVYVLLLIALFTKKIVK